jgi:glucose-6-phosphate isomerase
MSRFELQSHLNDVYAHFPEAEKRPVIGITGNYDDLTCKLGRGYYQSVVAAGGVPVVEITVPTLDEYTLGQLIYFFEFACGVSGYTLGVNPFDQPGVEAYKKNMFRLLGKPGF